MEVVPQKVEVEEPKVDNEEFVQVKKDLKLLKEELAALKVSQQDQSGIDKMLETVKTQISAQMSAVMST